MYNSQFITDFKDCFINLNQIINKTANKYKKIIEDYDISDFKNSSNYVEVYRKFKDCFITFCIADRNNKKYCYFYITKNNKLLYKSRHIIIDYKIDTSVLLNGTIYINNFIENFINWKV